jgi:selenocysteine lyase/cysteine desulfurase
MCDIDRRDFIRMSSVGAAGLGLTGAAVAAAAGGLEANRPVFFQGDGLNLGPREYADLLDGFEERFQRGIAVSEDLFSRLEKHPAFTLHRRPASSNVFVLDVQGVDPKAFRDRLETAGISMREPRDDGSIILQVNETWAAVSGEELGRRMVAALD